MEENQATQKCQGLTFADYFNDAHSKEEATMNKENDLQIQNQGSEY